MPQLAAVLAPDAMHARAAGGKLAIVNLQKTPKDRRAALVLRARADRVMAALMAALALQACHRDCLNSNLKPSIINLYP